jgi:hypothetical protein
MDRIAASPNQGSRNHFFTWLAARRLLISIAVMATAVAALYTEENWRGKRDWEKCRRELEAHGAVFDWNTRIPPPVPDAQNFFSAPHMTEWFVGRRTNELSQRLDNPRTHTVGSAGTNSISTALDARDYLGWSDQFEPQFDEIRAALNRPFARIDCDYSQPTTVLPPNFITIRNLVQTLAQRAHCFLLLGKPQEALGELTLIHDFCRVFDCAPAGKPITLIGAMIKVAVTGLYADTIAEGLQTHEWLEPQLAVLEQQLSAIHLETSFAETFVDEPMFTLRTLETSSREELLNIFGGLNGKSKTCSILLRFGPRGWLYQYMIFHVHLLKRFVAGFDAANQKVSPSKINEAGQAFQNSLEHVSPHNFLANWATPNWVKAIQKVASNQTIANEGAIACALERYRLIHGEFPETLDALVPQLIASLPHDLIGGQPLRYRRTDRSHFLLYSPGWNETDDGGVPSKSLEEGDWVWAQTVR